MYRASKAEILQHADLLCARLRINPSKTDIVLIMGDKEAHNNLDAMMSWVEDQADLVDLDQVMVRDKLFARVNEYLAVCFEALMDNCQGGIH